jgi:hypothetical protein
MFQLLKCNNFTCVLFFKVPFYLVHGAFILLQEVSCEGSGEIKSVHSITYLRTYLRSWALLEELSIVQPLKNFPAFYGTRRFNTVFKRALHWSLSCLHSIMYFNYLFILRWLSSVKIVINSVLQFHVCEIPKTLFFLVHEYSFLRSFNPMRIVFWLSQNYIYVCVSERI